MAMLLAPYTDSMRLGMGFNSYTHEACINSAVDISHGTRSTRSSELPQVVSYSSRLVERLGEVVNSMNLSYSSAIKKGTIEIAGDANVVDEEKIKESDLNVVVNVKVTNQSTLLTQDCKFKPMPISSKAFSGSKGFTDVYGDCFISGFVDGGEFTGIVSIRILDRSKVDSISNTIRQAVTKTKSNKFKMFAPGSSGSDHVSSSAFRETEMSYTVGWQGGGQIKDPNLSWNLDTVLHAAAAFPNSVAECPQRIYAILTPYKANRSFTEWVYKAQLDIHPLNYDVAGPYTAELFDNYITYKVLFKKVSNMIDEPDKYQVQKDKKGAIPVVIKTLVAVRSAIRIEMRKIVAGVEAITNDPEMLLRKDLSMTEPDDDIVKQIVGKGMSITPTVIAADDDGAPDFNFAALISPAIWADLLPVQVAPNKDANLATGGGLSNPSTVGFPARSIFDKAVFNTKNELNIVAAICGIYDVIDLVQQWKKPDGTMSIRASDISKLVEGRPKHPDPLFRLSLVMLFKYDDGPLRLFVIKATETPLPGHLDIGPIYDITPITTSDAVQVVPEPSTTWTEETWIIRVIVYGGWVCTDESILEKVRQSVKANYAAGGSRQFTPSQELFGHDPWSGVLKTCVVFYQSFTGGEIRCAVGSDGGSPVTLTDQVLTVQLPTPLPAKPRQLIMRSTFTEESSDNPFMVFQNGVQFRLSLDGELAIKQGSDLKWSSGMPEPSVRNLRPMVRWDPGLMQLELTHGWSIPGDNSPGRRQYKTIGTAPTPGEPKPEGTPYVMFADQPPYIELGRLQDDQQWIPTWQAQ